jgi:3-hydroxybutyryl-CoA dehydrogenase
MTSPIGSRYAVVGPGRIGRGVALAFAMAGHRVTLLDVKQRDAGELANLESTIRAALDQELRLLVQARAMTAAAAAITASLCIIDTSSYRNATSLLDHEVYFEGVPEELDVKRACFDWLARAARPDAVIASSTSTLPVAKLAAMLPNPERFLNAHWLNPAHLMPLVELSAAPTTSRASVDGLKAVLASIGKLPVECSDSAGYIVPRLQALAMNEAARMVQEGVASVEDIDRAVRAGFGVRYAVLGLLEFIDWGGCDILHHASRHLVEAHGSERFSAPAIVGENMASGRRGLRDGQGFYDFRGIDVEAYRRERMVSFIGLLGHLQLLPKALSPCAGGSAVAVDAEVWSDQNRYPTSTP